MNWCPDSPTHTILIGVLLEFSYLGCRSYKLKFRTDTINDQRTGTSSRDSGRQPLRCDFHLWCHRSLHFLCKPKIKKRSAR